MIRKLTLNKIATFTQAVEIEPSAINYFYGSNGSGKTTLSKVIADETAFPDCTLAWQNQPIETLVYNRDFVKSHFSQSSTIKGIFTLGKDATEAKAFIETTTKEIEAHTTALTALNNSLETKNTEIKTLDDAIVEKCWTIKGRYEQNFREAYTGFIGSKPAFFNKCKQEQSNTSTLLDFDTITEKCQRVFSESLQTYAPIHPLQLPDFDALENHPILATKIVGKEDLPIAALITKLSNSDWIKQGLGFLEQTENQCPFCQQSVSATLQDEIESVFDETYQQKITELNAYQANYDQTITSIIEKLKEVIQLEVSILDFTDLKSHIRLLEEAYKNNLASIDQKVKSPSGTVTLRSLSTDFKKAQNIIENYRTSIENNNATANNIKTEEATLKSEIWRFIVEELSTELTAYQTKLSGLKSGKKSIEDKITQRTTDKQSLEGKIKEKEADITSVIHTKNEINKILKSFGFTNFSISETENGYYKIIRQNGVDAKETLSEGEYTFITFLYLKFRSSKSCIQPPQAASGKASSSIVNASSCSACTKNLFTLCSMATM
ncbi:MAG: AAA family ATPase, partial [Candidatus Ruthia sp.]|nr:AAA family ATPase [Candidatus Ruthturnera sp.]MBT4178267.1 AAA family ATPase [Candidatus Neomarinimicrobiota bacterium]